MALQRKLLGQLCRHKCFRQVHPFSTDPSAPNEAKLVNQLLENSITVEEQAPDSRPFIDPEDKSILLFPGQGTQTVGMANDLLQYPNVKQMFAIASEILGFDLLKVCQDGPKSELDRTVHCQPAVMVTSLAGVEKMQAEMPSALESCCAAAGYSVGEFASLVFAGALSFEDAVKLIGVRGRAMQHASDDVASGMITAIGGAKTKFKFACLEARHYCAKEHNIDNPVCNVSAYLCPNVVTIGGHKEAIDFIRSRAQDFYIRKVTDIPVSGAFHTQLMLPAAHDLRTALKNIRVEKPLVEVYSNVSGKRYGSEAQIQRDLPFQIVMPVLWEQTLNRLFSRDKKVNMPALFEVGPGAQLGALVRKCNGKAWRNYTSVM